MKKLSVQIQSDLVTDIDAENIVELLMPLAKDTSLVQESHVTSGSDDGRYINIDFQTSDAPRLWQAIQSTLCLTSEKKLPISSAIMVVCEGENSWNDYLLLHHFDESKAIDIFPSPKLKPGKPN